MEVLPSDYDVHKTTQSQLDHIPVDLDFGEKSSMLKFVPVETHADPKPCCHFQGEGNKTEAFDRLPREPESHQLMTWEVRSRV